jgi:type IV fimbrial biogenesis protein FimT
MHCDERGFTLIELMIVLVVMATSLSVVVPAMTQWLHQQQLTSSSLRLAGTLALARSEAILRGRPVQVEILANDWSMGWRVFADNNRNGLADANEPILVQESGLPGNVSIRGNTPVRHYVRYTPDGSAKLKSGAFQAGTLTLCHQRSSLQTRQLILSATGRLRRARGPAGTC